MPNSPQSITHQIHPGLRHSDFFILDGHAWQIWLWDTPADLRRWSTVYGTQDHEADTIALHAPAVTNTNRPYQFMGHIHLPADIWTLEIVAHECLHGLFHYLVTAPVDFCRDLYFYDMDSQEEWCYDFGQMIDFVYRWLWKRNPWGKHSNG